MSKYVQIRKVPNDLAMLLARPDFGSFLNERQQIEPALELQLNTQSASIRALFLFLVGYSSLMNLDAKGRRIGPVRTEQITKGLPENAPRARSITLRQLPNDARTLLETNDFASRVPNNEALDAWTVQNLEQGGPPTRALYLIYRGLAALIGEEVLNKAIRTPLAVDAEDRDTGTRTNASCTATEAELVAEAADIQGETLEQPDIPFRSILPEDSPVWLAFNKGKS